MKQLFGEAPEIAQVIEKIEQMPPEEQGQAIQQFLEAMSANV
jgi:hypothetical protein